MFRCRGAGAEEQACRQRWCRGTEVQRFRGSSEMQRWCRVAEVELRCIGHFAEVVQRWCKVVQRCRCADVHMCRCAI